MVKEFEIQGRICNLPPEMTEEEFWHSATRSHTNTIPQGAKLCGR